MSQCSHNFTNFHERLTSINFQVVAGKRCIIVCGIGLLTASQCVSVLKCVLLTNFTHHKCSAGIWERLFDPHISIDMALGLGSFDILCAPNCHRWPRPYHFESFRWPKKRFRLPPTRRPSYDTKLTLWKLNVLPVSDWACQLIFK